MGSYGYRPRAEGWTEDPGLWWENYLQMKETKKNPSVPRHGFLAIWHSRRAALRSFASDHGLWGIGLYDLHRLPG